MMSQKEFIARLRADPLYKRALKLAQTDADRKRIIGTTEAVARQFFEALGPIGAHLKQDQSFGEKLQEALKRGAEVVRERDGNPVATTTSGSLG